ncbi:MAG: hypothetical protein B6244_10610 [Candidatus Cloacimonetes bacterium 4572_55]|nr:MAG: hypothetical protein B6244_10610 [Candidatus Cloacimonetes bacterium 4572_55]
MNSLVCVYLQNPREKFFGRLHELSVQGVQFVGIDIKSFDDWCYELVEEDEKNIFPSALYVPSWRIEKIVLDESQGVLKSFSENFYQRTDQKIELYFPIIEL